MYTVNLDLIKQRRKELNISIREMTLYLGFKNESTYYRYEEGVKRLKAEHVPAISKKLGMEMNEFFLNSEVS